MTTNIRVVPRGMHKGAVLFAAALGMVAAGCLLLLYTTSDVFFLNAEPWEVVVVSIGVCGASLIPMMWVVLICASSPRLGVAAAAAAVGYVSLAMACMAALVLAEYNGDFSMGLDVYVWMIVVGGVIWISAVLPAITALAICGLARLCIVRTIEQPGSLCWICVYDLSANGSGSPCPECGTSPAANRPRRRAIINTVRFCNRHAAKTLASMFIVAVALMSWRLVTWVYPIASLKHAVSAVPGSSNPTWAGAFEIDTLIRGVEMAVVVPGHPGHCIQVDFFPRTRADVAPLKLSVATLESYHDGTFWCDAVDPPLSITLTPEQTRHVRRNGIPPELITAMHDRWLTARAEYDSLRSQGADTSHLESKHALDPAPFFPASPQ